MTRYVSKKTPKKDMGELAKEDNTDTDITPGEIYKDHTN